MSQAIRIDDGAAFERSDDANDAYFAEIFIRGNFHKRSDVTALFEAAAHSESLAGLRFLLRPAKTFCGGFENRAQARVGKTGQPSFQRVELDGAGPSCHHSVS